MIDINLYRSRIGGFNQCGRNSKLKLNKIFRRQCTGDDKTGVLILSILQVAVKLVLIVILMQPGCHQPCNLDPAQASGWVLPTTANLQPRLGMTAWSISGGNIQQTVYNSREPKGNFYARYTNGNRQHNRKGIRNMHLNIRSLGNKISEIKILIKEHKPHIFGISETQLKKIQNEYDEARLRIPGYDLLFPKSWSNHGFARVVVYVKSSLEYEQVHAIEDDKVQSIWIRGGFKNSTKVYYCHVYREHTSTLGNSLQSQRAMLDQFLLQWEDASEIRNGDNPNEIHISGDMNLDALNGKWLDNSYHLVSLSRMVQAACNLGNFCQLVSVPTRFQFNRVRGETEISCIDHIYTNCKFRCSEVNVIPFGGSDHDLLMYLRYSKDPPDPARTIRRRSYKTFVADNFLADLSKVDWTEVYTCQDLDVAVDTFTRNFREVLNPHAPWG